MIYRPTDLAFGPDGAIYALGWGSNYHYEPGSDGSWVFRVSHRDAATHRSGSRQTSNVRALASPATPLAKRSVAQLLNELDPGVIPARRVNAQDELVRRGAAISDELVKAIFGGELTTGQQTWAIWAVGRVKELGEAHVETIRKCATPPARSKNAKSIQSASLRVPRNLRIQAIRILAFRASRFGESDPTLFAATTAMTDPDPRVRFEAIQAVHQAGLKSAAGDVLRQLVKETDRVVFYAGWQALRDLASLHTRRSWLNHASSRVRLAALLGLQEDYAVTQKDVLALVDRETDPLVQSWALTFAMNPLPPAKLSNDTLRIEMEQTLPIGQMIERARQAERPELRRLYLQMIARASVREGEQQKQLLAFYRTLQSADERALILPAAATTRDAFPDLWEALGGTQPLQSAAVAGIGNLHRLHVKQLSSAESAVGLTSRSVSNVNRFAAEIADQLLAKMTDVGPADARIPAALRALDSLPLPNDWSPSDAALNTILAILDSREEPPTRRRALRLLGKLEPKSVAGSKPVVTVLTKLCKQPDALLYRDLLAVKTHLGLEIDVPKPPAATIEGVLARLEQADADRGRELFFDHVGGAGCVSCHRVRGRGSDVAPDLSGVGVRLTPENMVKSIIQPSAAITEGYAVQLLVTDDGRTHSGAVIRETSSTITLLRTDGTQVSLATGTIESRKRLKRSVMPDGYDLFGAEQLADLTAWLLTLRDGVAIASEKE